MSGRDARAPMRRRATSRGGARGVARPQRRGERELRELVLDGEVVSAAAVNRRDLLRRSSNPAVAVLELLARAAGAGRVAGDLAPGRVYCAREADPVWNAVARSGGL